MGAEEVCLLKLKTFYTVTLVIIINDVSNARECFLNKLILKSHVISYIVRVLIDLKS